MKRSFLPCLVFLLSALPSQTILAQTSAEADTPQFHFPLEVGNVWVYLEYGFPFCRDRGCLMYRLEVIDQQTIDGGFCGSLIKIVSRSFYDSNWQISSSVRQGQHEFTLCQIGNSIYWYDGHVGNPEFHVDRNMIANFDRDESQPWVIAFDSSQQLYPYRLRRLFDRDLKHEVGPYGRIEYLFSNYLAEKAQDLEGPSGGEFVSGKQDYFTSGVGFPVLGWGFFYTGSLRGYYVNGVITGDTMTVQTTSIDRDPIESPVLAALTSVYPNPFNPSTVIGYRLSGAHGGTPVRVFVVDLLGREVAVLFDGMQAPGSHSATFDATHLPSGVYVVVLHAGNTTDRRMITLVK